MNPFKKILFRDVLCEWLRYHETEIAASTAYSYRTIAGRIETYFSDIDIRRIDSNMLNDYISTRGIRRQSVRNHGKVLSMCFRYALSMGYVKSNPMDNVILPKRESHHEIRIFSEREISLLLQQDYLQWFLDGVLIAYRTGMRPGEIYALRWSDVNFERGFMSVQRALSQAGGKIIIKTTKTACGVRRIDIDSHLCSYLHRVKLHGAGCEYVFPPVPDSIYPMRVPWNLAHHMRILCQLAGISPRDFYTLRHTHASELLAHGVHPKIVQERMGHSDTKITMMIYSHTTPTLQREAVNVFEGIGIPGMREEPAKIVDIMQY